MRAMMDKLVKSIFNTANLNGSGALLMSVDVGTTWSTYLYGAAILAGTVNKYRGLSGANDNNKGIMNYITNPSVTACAFMIAAGYNFIDATTNFLTQPDELKAMNGLLMLGWGAAFLGDNALRRLDKVNFKQSAEALGRSMKSRISKTFNALCSNPTLFYGFASTGMVTAELAHRFDDIGNKIPMFSGPEGVAAGATVALVGAGTAYALSRTWQSAQGKIPMEKINDGIMNSMAFLAKIGYTGLAFVSGQYGLAAGHLMFSISSLKSIFETRAALHKDDNQDDKPDLDNNNKTALSPTSP